MAEKNSVIAISVIEFNKFGCPYCGFRSGFTPTSYGGAAVWQCGECGKTCCVLGEGIVKSSIGFGGNFYPKLQAHPRHGIPSHGRPDKKPENGGEFFHSRGIGYDTTPGCFVCGGNKGLYHNIAAFVQCKEAGERVVAMISRGTYLDYRDFEPDRVQVKVGACKIHLSNLQKLHDLTKKDGIITTDIIQKTIC